MRLIILSPLVIAAIILLCAAVAGAVSAAGVFAMALLNGAALVLLASAALSWQMFEQQISEPMTILVDYLRATRDGALAEPPRELNGVIGEVGALVTDIVARQMQTNSFNTGLKAVDQVAQSLAETARSAKTDQAHLTRAVAALWNERNGARTKPPEEVVDAAVARFERVLVKAFNRSLPGHSDAASTQAEYRTGSPETRTEGIVTRLQALESAIASVVAGITDMRLALRQGEVMALRDSLSDHQAETKRLFGRLVEAVGSAASKQDMRSLMLRLDGFSENAAHREAHRQALNASLDAFCQRLDRIAIEPVSFESRGADSKTLIALDRLEVGLDKVLARIDMRADAQLNHPKAAAWPEGAGLMTILQKICQRVDALGEELTTREQAAADSGALTASLQRFAMQLDMIRNSIDHAFDRAGVPETSVKPLLDAARTMQHTLAEQTTTLRGLTSDLVQVLSRVPGASTSHAPTASPGRLETIERDLSRLLADTQSLPSLLSAVIDLRDRLPRDSGLVVTDGRRNHPTEVSRQGSDSVPVRATLPAISDFAGDFASVTRALDGVERQLAETTRGLAALRSVGDEEIFRLDQLIVAFAAQRRNDAEAGAPPAGLVSAAELADLAAAQNAGFTRIATLLSDKGTLRDGELRLIVARLDRIAESLDTSDLGKIRAPLDMLLARIDRLTPTPDVPSAPPPQEVLPSAVPAAPVAVSTPGVSSLLGALRMMSAFTSSIEARFSAFESMAAQLRINEDGDGVDREALDRLTQNLDDMRALTERFLDISCAISNELAQTVGPRPQDAQPGAKRQSLVG